MADLASELVTWAAAGVLVLDIAFVCALAVAERPRRSDISDILRAPRKRKKR